MDIKGSNITGCNISGTLFSGQEEYVTPGSYTWYAPPDVTSVCVVCIGGGGAGTATNYTNSGGAGGGGGLGWKNNIPVVPGTGYTVVVGTGGSGNTAGNWSYFSSPSVVVGNGGSTAAQAMGQAGAAGGTYVGDGGGNGGTGGSVNISTSAYQAGGGGAGGYTGAGGNGGNGSSSGAPTAATAGSGGGGGGGGGSYGVSGATVGYQAGGGGTGIYGQGTNGSGAATVYGASSGTNYSAPQGGGGSGGEGGTVGTPNAGFHGGDYRMGGLYGGGGGTYGGSGAVRIIWGAGRAFPSTNTADTVQVWDFISNTKPAITQPAVPTLNSVTATTSYRYSTNGVLIMPVAKQSYTSRVASFPVNLDYTKTYTLEFWHYFDAVPTNTANDGLVYLTTASNHLVYISANHGSTPGFLYSSDNTGRTYTNAWNASLTGTFPSVVAGQWVHYVLAWSPTGIATGAAVSGSTGNRYYENSLWLNTKFIQNVTSLSFGDSTFNYFSSGYKNQISITEGDTYNLLTGAFMATYNPPSNGEVTVNNNTRYWFRTK